MDQYASDRSCSAASRLNYQLYLGKNTLEFNPHPSIPTPKRTARIADVTKETSIWGSLNWLTRSTRNSSNRRYGHYPFSGPPKAIASTEYQYESLEHIRGPPRRPCGEIRHCPCPAPPFGHSRRQQRGDCHRAPRQDAQPGQLSPVRGAERLRPIAS